MSDILGSPFLLGSVCGFWRVSDEGPIHLRCIVDTADTEGRSPQHPSAAESAGVSGPRIGAVTPLAVYWPGGHLVWLCLLARSAPCLAALSTGQLRLVWRLCLLARSAPCLVSLYSWHLPIDPSCRINHCLDPIVHRCLTPPQ